VSRGSRSRPPQGPHSHASCVPSSPSSGPVAMLGLRLSCGRLGRSFCLRAESTHLQTTDRAYDTLGLVHHYASETLFGGSASSPPSAGGYPGDCSPCNPAAASRYWASFCVTCWLLTNACGDTKIDRQLLAWKDQFLATRDPSHKVAPTTPMDHISSVPIGRRRDRLARVIEAALVGEALPDLDVSSPRGP